MRDIKQNFIDIRYVYLVFIDLFVIMSINIPVYFPLQFDPYYSDKQRQQSMVYVYF